MTCQKRCLKRCLVFLVASAASLGLLHHVDAQLIDFEQLVGGQIFFEIDQNLDGINDLRFSTTDVDGFNTFGPTPESQVFALGQVLESSSIVDPDIRVDFIGGASGEISLGFVLLTGVDDPGQGLQVQLFDQLDNLLASKFQAGEILPVPGLGDEGMSQFPEGFFLLSFDGTASYALVDATTTGTRFAIDNFNGIFSPAQIPEPASAPCCALIFALSGSMFRRRAEVAC